MVAAGLLTGTGALGSGVAAAETAYAVGGAKFPGVPWYHYTQAVGQGYQYEPTRVVVDYPAGIAQARFVDDIWPDSGLPTASVGESVAVGTDHLDAALRSTGGQAVAVGLSEGALVLNAEQARLAGDPSAPPPDQLSFALFGDPAGRHAFGESFLTSVFPPGSVIPMIDYRIPEPVQSQYDTERIVAAYDGFADFPDRPNLVSMANATAGAALVHTAVAFSDRTTVPPENIRTTTNSRGGHTTTYLVPNKHLPLTLPLRLAGLPDHMIDSIDSTLQPVVDAGYSRNDDPGSAPVAVDPVSGMDPVEVLRTVDPATASMADLDQVVGQAWDLFQRSVG